MNHQRNIGCQPSILNIIGLSSLIGGLAGLMAIAYRYSISQIETLRQIIYQNQNVVGIISTILLFIGFSYIVHRLLVWAPYSNGSGIPQIKAELMDKLDDKPLPTLVSKFCGGLLTALMGYSLGREGPSIQMGGMVGKQMSLFFKQDLANQKYLITAGASAGLAAAFNAPLAGILFAVEEMSGQIESKLILSAFCSALVANTVSFSLMGYENSFSFSQLDHLPLSSLTYLVVLGILSGLVAFIFNQGLDWTDKAFKKMSIPNYFKISLVSILVFMIGQKFPQVLGGGHSLIELLNVQPWPLSSLLVILLMKLVLTLISYNSGVQGGIFLPVLVLGALTGAGFNQILSLISQHSDWGLNMIVLGMVGVLTGVVQAPLMSIILITEMTGSLSHFLNLCLVALTALLTSHFLNNPPVYQTLYQKLISRLKPHQ